MMLIPSERQLDQRNVYKISFTLIEIGSTSLFHNELTKISRISFVQAVSLISDVKLEIQMNYLRIP